MPEKNEMEMDGKGNEAVEDIDDISELKKSATKDHEYKGYGFKEDLSAWCKFKAPLVGEIRFNPVVSFFAIFFIWAFVIWCIIKGEDVPFGQWKKWTVDNFTWLYIGSQDIWAIFAIMLYFSKYADLKLGKPHEKPEYNDVSWFMMLFACGIGVGLFFYGVYEPVYHYYSRNRYTADSTTPDNTLAQVAINLTLYHWGIHGWIVYCLVGLLLGLVSYREGLPMTMKSCFYPLIGDRIFGWIGDLIDVVSIMTTLFGVCTSLGLGTRQLNTGLSIINSDVPPDSITIQVIIIWCITAIATISTVSGVGMGIRRLSELCFGVGMFIMIVCFFADETFYVLNLFVQSIGFYFQYLMQLGWHTDAFEQLGPSHGGQERNRFVPQGHEAPDGPKDWMDGWTMFYWGWWISWCPFVGMFIAKISRGRTIRQFINGTLTAPVVYSFMWMVLFGGIGIKMEREAANVGLCCGSKFNNASVLIDNVAGLNDTMIKDGQVDNIDLCLDGACNDCSLKVIEFYSNKNFSYGQFINARSSLGPDFGSTLPNRSAVRLSCHSVEQMWFDVMRSYEGIGPFLSIFSLFAIVLYFVTSSDSGSLVIDCLTSNGDPDPPRIQRVFWALMEGATATALLVAGGKEGLSALQTAGVVSGLPYTVVICLLCVSTWRAVKVAHGDLDPHGPTFAIGLFDPLFAKPFKKLKVGTTFKLFLRLLANIFIAPLTAAQVAAKAYGKDEEERSKSWPYAIVTFLLFGLFITCHLLEQAVENMWTMGWFFYLGFTCFLTTVRLKVRELGCINGNVSEDFFSSLFLYPNVILQMEETLDLLEKKDKLPKPEIEHKNGEVKKPQVNLAFEDEQKN